MNDDEYDFSLSLPVFPLNTDGFDTRGRDIVIRRVNMTVFDDAVAVKPSYQNGLYATCTENVLVEDCQITNSVGLTIGTIIPSPLRPCIRDVHFRNNTMNYPIKAIYMKNNPLNKNYEDGWGGISNILYEDLKIHFPIWWGIFIGPQQ